MDMNSMVGKKTYIMLLLQSGVTVLNTFQIRSKVVSEGNEGGVSYSVSVDNKTLGQKLAAVKTFGHYHYVVCQPHSGGKK